MLYRYMNVKKFKDLCYTSSLVFVNPLVHWEDYREGPLFQNLKSGKGIKKLKKASMKYGAEEKEAFKVIMSVAPRVRAQCWTHAKDDQGMWKEYGNDGVMISASLEGLRKIPFTKRYDVRYVDDPISIQEELDHIILEQGIHVSGLFLTKRRAEFAYEQEVRIFQTEGTVDCHDRPDMIDVSVNLKNLISSVILHPNASTDTEEIVKNLCMNYGLRYDGKSSVVII